VITETIATIPTKGRTAMEITRDTHGHNLSTPDPRNNLVPAAAPII
jgi:hypothetical protein